jgi:hypothetical protein
MNYGLTGARGFRRDRHEGLVVPVFEEMADGEQFTTGGASGFDVFALYKLLQMYPKAHHRVIMPWDRSQAIELCDIPRAEEAKEAE